MENKGFVHGEQPPPYDPQAKPQPQPQPQMQPHMQPQPQPHGEYGYQAQPYPIASSQSSTSNVVVVAPQAQTMTTVESVPDNLVLSIISIFFCCILGIVATIKASDSKDALRLGDIERAKRSSVTAKNLAIAAIIIGCVCGVISILISIIAPVVAAASVSSDVDY